MCDLKEKIDKSVTFGVNSIVMGMPHRGRLNILSNVVRKPNVSIFSEFSGSKDDSVEGSGDVKYHLGMVIALQIKIKELRSSYAMW